MRKLFLLAGIAALTAAVPAAAEAQGRGNGRGNSVRAEQQTRVNVNRDRARTQAAARAQARAEAQRRAQRDVQRTWTDRNRDGIDDRAQNRYGGASCPPGLANRNPACVPPGQARRAFRQGQVLPQSFSYYTPYEALLGRIPQAYRDDIPVGNYRYIYRDDAVYVVDPTTRIVRSIIDLID
jgi:hypothetical protein